jgi:citrate synthase
VISNKKVTSANRLPKTSAPEFVDADAASILLGIKPQTLYSYVSRGLVRVAPKQGTKKSQYFLEDLEEAKLKGRRVSIPRQASEQVIHIGSSFVLHTAITAISADGPIYRGRLAVDLVRQRRCFEDCAELMWSGTLPQQRTNWRRVELNETFVAFTKNIGNIAGVNSPRRIMALTTEAFAASSGPNAEAQLGVPILAARDLIQVLAPVFGFLTDRRSYKLGEEYEPIASVVGQSCGLDVPAEVLDIIDACLILAADHELAPSTYAVRIAASTGADVFACINSALGAFDGLLTGMGCDESEHALLNARSPNEFVKSIVLKRTNKESISGFGHPLYPKGDPRAAILLKMVRDVSGRNQVVNRMLRCIEAVHNETGLAPNLAVALVVMSNALKMPRQSAGALMALGRTAGWAAHIFEQRLAGFIVRPRAKYIGTPRL